MDVGSGVGAKDSTSDCPPPGAALTIRSGLDGYVPLKENMFVTSVPLANGVPLAMIPPANVASV